MRFLTSHDVRELIDVDDMNELVEEAYRQLGADSATDIPRETVRSQSLAGNLKSMPAVGESGLGGIFYTGGFGDRPNSVVSKLCVVFDPDDGDLACVIESDRLSWLRTGATSAVATDYCARPGSSEMGLIGAGKQARSQLLAIDRVRDLETVRVFARTEATRKAFADEMSEAVDAAVTPVENARAAVEEADIVSTATTSSEPVLEGDWLAPGTHVNAIGAHYPDEREVDTRTVERSRVIVDALDRAQKEEGELIIPVEAGDFDWGQTIELGDVVAGHEPGRTSADDITYMTSGGLSAEYLVVSSGIYQRALEAGIGTELTIDAMDRCAI